jgi:hypothetical protein
MYSLVSLQGLRISFSPFGLSIKKSTALVQHRDFVPCCDSCQAYCIAPRASSWSWFSDVFSIFSILFITFLIFPCVTEGHRGSSVVIHTALTKPMPLCYESFAGCPSRCTHFLAAWHMPRMKNTQINKETPKRRKTFWYLGLSENFVCVYVYIYILLLYIYIINIIYQWISDGFP